jgi:periplasmic divalent cation tolerance protein
MPLPPALLVITTLPDQEAAENLGHQLVAAHLAACVTILSPCRSIYRWQGNLHTDGEVPLLIKTTAARYPELETWIHQHHPYELPEVLAVHIDGGLPPYLDWIVQETNNSRSL